MDDLSVDRPDAETNSQILAYPTVALYDMEGSGVSAIPVVQLQTRAEEEVEAEVAELVRLLKVQEKKGKKGTANLGSITVYKPKRLDRIKELLDAHCEALSSHHCDEELITDWRMVHSQAKIVAELALLRVTFEHYAYRSSFQNAKSRRTADSVSSLGKRKLKEYYTNLAAEFEVCAKHYMSDDRTGMYIHRMVDWLRVHEREWKDIYDRIANNERLKWIVSDGKSDGDGKIKPLSLPERSSREVDGMPGASSAKLLVDECQPTGA